MSWVGVAGVRVENILIEYLYRNFKINTLVISCYLKSMLMKTHKDLIVWQKSLDFVTNIFLFPGIETDIDTHREKDRKNVKIHPNNSQKNKKKFETFLFIYLFVPSLCDSLISLN